MRQSTAHAVGYPAEEPGQCGCGVLADVHTRREERAESRERLRSEGPKAKTRQAPCLTEQFRSFLGLAASYITK